MSNQSEITKAIARKVLKTVDAGLVGGVGVPAPGQMCVEAAVCYALGLPHGDDPGCVAPALRALKIRLNDSNWSSPASRAAGMRRLAVAQLGSASALDEKEFASRVVDYAIRVSTPKALRIAADKTEDTRHRDALRAAANRCENEGTRESAYAAYAATIDAAAAAAAAFAAAFAAADDVNAAAANAANAAVAAADAAADAAAYAADDAAYAAD